MSLGGLLQTASGGQMGLAAVWALQQAAWVSAARLVLEEAVRTTRWDRPPRRWVRPPTKIGVVSLLVPARDEEEDEVSHPLGTEWRLP